MLSIQQQNMKIQALKWFTKNVGTAQRKVTAFPHSLCRNQDLQLILLRVQVTFTSVWVLHWLAKVKMQSIPIWVPIVSAKTLIQKVLHPGQAPTQHHQHLVNMCQNMCLIAFHRICTKVLDIAQKAICLEHQTEKRVRPKASRIKIV